MKDCNKELGDSIEQELNCPTCDSKFKISETQAMPFCSERCRLIDLGRWLDEGIGIPHESEPDEESIEDVNG